MYINMLSDYLKESFGEKLYRIALDGGMSCPNRDGTCGTRGCIFCGEQGSGEFAQSRFSDISQQIEDGKKLIAHKSKSDKYIAYFQAFSNTYAPIEYLSKLYHKVIIRDDIAVLSIATRPDCLSDDVLKLLKELNEIKPVWVELGLQTVNSKTADFIRRGYSLDIYEKGVINLKAIGCKVITHIIFGLPFESKSEMLSTAAYAGAKSDGVKFHMLYVTEGTDLEKLYRKGEINLLSRDEYIDILCEAIRLTPKSTVIHRLTGDGDKRILVAPKWTENKKRVLREIENALWDRNIEQGERLINLKNIK